MRFVFSIEFNGELYNVYGHEIIIIYKDGDFMHKYIIPTQFSEKLHRYSEEKIKQFLTVHLPDIVDFANSYGEYLIAMIRFDHSYYDNDERVAEFFEGILSSLRHQTKSAR